MTGNPSANLQPCLPCTHARLPAGTLARLPACTLVRMLMARYGRLDCKGGANAFWERNHNDFDNIGASMLCLFNVATLEGWLETLNLGMDARGVGEAPAFMFQPAASIYFVIFTIVAAFFLMNIFTGVVIDSYHRAKLELDGAQLLTGSQRVFMGGLRKIIGMFERCKRKQKIHHMRYNPKVSRPRRLALTLALDPNFEPTVSTLILLNVAISCTQHFDQSQVFTTIQDISEITFTVFFGMESIIKLIALGPKMFIGDKFNVLDALLVLVSAVLLISDILPARIATVTRITRIVLRLGRAIRSSHVFAKTRRMVKALLDSILSLINVGGILIRTRIFFHKYLGSMPTANADSLPPIGPNTTSRRDVFDAALGFLPAHSAARRHVGTLRNKRPALGHRLYRLRHACDVLLPQCQVPAVCQRKGQLPNIRHGLHDTAADVDG